MVIDAETRLHARKTDNTTACKTGDKTGAGWGGAELSRPTSTQTHAILCQFPIDNCARRRTITGMETTNYQDQFGMPATKLTVAAAIWYQMTVAQRYEIMHKVAESKSITTWLRRCINYMASNMIDYTVVGNTITGTLK